MAEENRVVALALMAHLLKLLVFVFPKSADAQKMKEKFTYNQVWFPKGLDTDKCHSGQGVNQINCGPNIMQMTKVDEGG